MGKKKIFSIIFWLFILVFPFFVWGWMINQKEIYDFVLFNCGATIGNTWRDYVMLVLSILFTLMTTFASAFMLYRNIKSIKKQ